MIKIGLPSQTLQSGPNVKHFTQIPLGKEPAISANKSNLKLIVDSCSQIISVACTNLRLQTKSKVLALQYPVVNRVR